MLLGDLISKLPDSIYIYVYFFEILFYEGLSGEFDDEVLAICDIQKLLIDDEYLILHLWGEKLHERGDVGSTFMLGILSGSGLVFLINVALIIF